VRVERDAPDGCIRQPAVGPLRHIARAPVLDHVVPAGLQVILEQGLQRSGRQDADVRSVIDDEVKAFRCESLTRVLQERCIGLIAAQHVHSGAEVDRGRLQIDPDDRCSRQAVAPHRKRVALPDAELEERARAKAQACRQALVDREIGDGLDAGVGGGARRKSQPAVPARVTTYELGTRRTRMHAWQCDTAKRYVPPVGGWLTRLLLGNGTLKPGLRAALESEGLVVLEEGLTGSIKYSHFKAPGKRFNGKVTGECFGLGISERRLAVYCRSGRVKLIDQPFTEPRLSAIDVSVDDNDRVALLIDYDRVDVPKVSGQMTIRARTPNATMVVEELNSRLGR